jgi:hypothetical protein
MTSYGTPGECLFCGRYSTRRVAGVCPSCRRKGRSVRLRLREVAAEQAAASHAVGRRPGGEFVGYGLGQASFRVVSFNQIDQ